MTKIDFEKIKRLSEIIDRSIVDTASEKIAEKKTDSHGNYYTLNKNRKIHSFYCLPSLVMNNGTKFWHDNGLLHREDGPAVEHANGEKEWYRNGHLHREDGPAVEGANGVNRWYINGERVPPKESS